MNSPLFSFQANVDTLSIGLFNNTVLDMKLKDRVDAHYAMFQNLESEHLLHRNETSAKGMSLMDQVSELFSSISDLDEKQSKQGSDFGDRVDTLNNLISGVEEIVRENWERGASKDMILMDQVAALNGSLLDLDGALGDSNAQLQSSIDEQGRNLTSRVAEVRQKCAMAEQSLGAVIREQVRNQSIRNLRILQFWHCVL